MEKLPKQNLEKYKSDTHDKEQTNAKNDYQKIGQTCVIKHGHWRNKQQDFIGSYVYGLHKLYHRKLKLQSSNVLKENRKLFQFWMDVKSLLCVFLKGYCPVPNCRGEGECTLRQWKIPTSGKILAKYVHNNGTINNLLNVPSI